MRPIKNQLLCCVGRSAVRPNPPGDFSCASPAFVPGLSVDLNFTPPQCSLRLTVLIVRYHDKRD